MSASRRRRIVALVATALVAGSAQPTLPAAASALSVRQPGDIGPRGPKSDPPTASSSPFVSDTPIPTDPGTPTDLPTPSDLPTPTDPGSPTDPPTPTDTPTPTDPGTPTDTPTPTDPGTPTDTPTPTDPGSPVQTPGGTPPTNSGGNGGSTGSGNGGSTGSGNGGSTGSGNGTSGPGTAKPGAAKPGTATVRPHPRKTLRPTPAVPGVSRPHPRRKPWPITMTLKTVPALAGVRFTVDGHQLVTGPNGMTSYTAEHDFAGHRLTVVSSSVTTPDKRYQFYRWAGQRDPNQAFSRTVSGLPMRSNYVVTAAFTVQHQVMPRVIRQDGTALDPAQVNSVVARSDNGSMVNLPLTSPTWLDASRPAFHHSVLSAEPVTYSLQTVMVRGTNVVDAGRQTFKPTTTLNPTFTTQFYDLVITGHDAIFKSGLGTSATVTYPDGGKLTVPLNAEHTATLTNLPRGTYKVTLDAGRAIVGVQQFGLSKDKTADLIVISALDLAILVGVLLMIAVALLVIGRQYWRRLLHRLRREHKVGALRGKIVT